MKRLNGKLLLLCASALLFYGCEKEDDLIASKADAQTTEECDVITFENRDAGSCKMSSKCF